MIQKDKIYHFMSGLILSFIGGIIHPFGIITGFIAGIIKEFYDYYHPKHTFDIWDCIATFIGAIVGVYLLYYII